MEEEVAKGEFNKLSTNLNKQLKFTKEDLDEKILVKSEKQGASAQLEKDLAAETNAKEADQAFKDDLEADCKAKDDMDKKKQTARESEMEAIQTAIDHLAAGGVSLAQVQSLESRGLKLKKTGVQVNRHAPKAFFQLRSRRAEQAKKHDADMAMLRDMANKTGVSAAARLVERAAHASDPFVEVRKLFSDLLARMNSQAQEEATNNGDCTEKVATHAKERDDMQAESETKTNEITAVDFPSSSSTRRSSNSPKMSAKQLPRWRRPPRSAQMSMIRTFLQRRRPRMVSRAPDLLWISWPITTASRVGLLCFSHLQSLG